MLTWLAISKEAVKYNLKQLKKIVGGQVELMAVVKANAYGHGLAGIAKICDLAKEASRLCVVSLDEALILKKEGIKKPILILGFYELDYKKISLAIKNKIIFPLYTMEQVAFLNRVGEKLRKKVPVHLKIDTGTTRIGVLPSDALSLAKKIQDHRHLILEGVWSHFSSSEENTALTKSQYKIFTNVVNELKTTGIDPPIKHIACSAAVILNKNFSINAARVGLALYGLHPTSKTKSVIKLKPALSWYTKIIQVKKVPPGTKVSYGATYTFRVAGKIAVIPVGYADGFDRNFSNQAKVIIRGNKCPVRGRVCMNLTMVDVTKLKNVKVGDIVTIIGQNGKSAIAVDNLAKQANRINYEIVERINPTLPRIFM